MLSNARRDAIAATKLSAAIVSNIKPAVNVSATNATFKITDTNCMSQLLLYQLKMKKGFENN